MRDDLITVHRLDEGSEEFRTSRASMLNEAVTMAERDCAGVLDACVGIQPEDYSQAQAEGIAFNEADGLLL